MSSVASDWHRTHTHIQVNRTHRDGCSIQAFHRRLCKLSLGHEGNMWHLLGKIKADVSPREPNPHIGTLSFTQKAHLDLDR